MTTPENEHPQYGMKRPTKELHHYLLGWYDAAKRSMPWRETTDPYAIWLSETMLQQTQVETVKPYYHRFLEAFPTVAALAAADLQQVLAMWAGLGYYRRARSLHGAAQKMVSEFGGRVPETLEGLLSLPGVGRYTAGAVGSIAFGLPAAVVDGNVMRVLARLTGFEGEISEPRSVAFFWKTAEEILARAGEGSGTPSDPPGTPGRPPSDPPEMPSGMPRYGDINQSLMELGATICTPPPSRPACLVCPIKTFCRAYAEGRQLQLPVKKRKGEVPVVRGVAVVVTRKGEGNRERFGALRHKGSEGGEACGEEVLVMQRPRGVVWEEMWEFPVVEMWPGQEEEGGGGEGKRQMKGGRGKGRGAEATSVYSESSIDVLRLDTSIKNGHGDLLAGDGVSGDGVGRREREVGGVAAADGGAGGGGGAAGEFGVWVRRVAGALLGGLPVERVVRCGEVRHGLTHRMMVFEVVRVEVGGGEGDWEGTEALRHKGTEGGGGTQNSKLKIQNVLGEERLLPVGATMGGKRYVGARWVKWPLAVRGEVPLARVVFKVAERAEGEGAVGEK